MLRSAFRWLLSASPRADLAALVLRLTIGPMFFLHGVGKPLVVGMETVTADFGANGFPVWTAYASTVVEISAGTLLLAGWHARLAACALMPVTLGILVYHAPNGWVFHHEGGGWEYPAFILGALAAQAALGDGAASVGQRRRRASSRAASAL